MCLEQLTFVDRITGGHSLVHFHCKGSNMVVNPRSRVLFIRHSTTAIAGLSYYLWNDQFLDRKVKIKEAGGLFRYFFGEKNQEGHIM